MDIYFGKHSKPEEVIECFNDDVKAFIDLRRVYLGNCEDNTGRIKAWRLYAQQFRQYRIKLIGYLFDKGVRASILNFNGKYEMVGPLYSQDEIFPF